MKYLPYLYSIVLLFLCSCSDDSETLKNEIDFSTPYAIVDDPNDPIQHHRYEIYKEHEVSVYFNDTISRTEIGKDYDGNMMYRYETLDLNWQFSSNNHDAVSYRFVYLTKPEEQEKALRFVDIFIEQSSEKMRPFTIFLTDSIVSTNIAGKYEERPQYMTSFRTLAVSQLQNLSDEEMKSLVSEILRNMLQAKITENKTLVDRFGSVSSTDNYYNRSWVNSGSNEGLGCNAEYFGKWWLSPNKFFDEEKIEYILIISHWTYEEFEAIRAEMVAEMGQFGFICGNKYVGANSSPSDVDEDLESYINIILEIGKEEFINRYGGSALVMEKYQLLVDFIEGDLGVEL